MGAICSNCCILLAGSDVIGMSCAYVYVWISIHSTHRSSLQLVIHYQIEDSEGLSILLCEPVKNLLVLQIGSSPYLKTVFFK